MRKFRFLSILVIFVLLGVSLSAVTTAVKDNENYFKNGSFEDRNNTEFIGVTGSPSFSDSTDATDGTRSLKVTSTSNYAHIGLPLELEKGRTYEYSFDVKLISDGKNNPIDTYTYIYVNFRFADTIASNAQKNHVIVGTTATSESGWHRISGSYTPRHDEIADDADLENALFCVYVNPTDGGGAVWLIDNVTLKRTPDANDPDNVNYFKNGSFEDVDNIEMIGVTGSPSFSQDLEASDGIYSLKVSSKSNYSHIGFPISLDEGRTYKFSFDIKLLSDGYGNEITALLPLCVNFRFADEKSTNGKKNHVIIATYATSSSGWHHVVGEYTPSYDKIAEDADLENALFCIYPEVTPGGGATYLLDNIVLKRAPLESEETSVLTPDIISDNMLVQKGMPIPVWGTTAAADTLDIILYNGTTVVSRVSTAVENGSFDTELPAVNSYYKNLSLVFESDGTAVRTIENVAVGELWHFGGQSNMQSNATDEKPNIVPSTDKPDIHYFKVDVDGAGKWVTVTLSNVRTISAITYKTLETMQLSLGSDVPVGGLNTSIGGVRISRFMENGDLYNTRLVPISKIPVKGHFFYQGESDVNNNNYASDLARMVDDWRTLWNDNSQPFIYVQLPRSPATIPDWYSNLDANGNPTKTICYNYTRVHMQQYDAYQSLKDDNVYMIVAIDITTKIDTPKSAENKSGEDPLHPRNKAPVAIRLGNTALHEIYGKSQVKHEFPMPADVTVDGKYIYIKYSGVYNGLVTTGDVPEHFEIIDANGNYHVPTHTEIESANSIMLYCDDVEEPAGVCYFHEEHLIDMSLPFREFVPSIMNSEGLPAVPFTYTITTDDRIDYSSISVPANSTVYFTDGTSKAYDDEAIVRVPKAEGYIYVNTGFDAHTVYYVDADGVPTEITVLDNALLAFNGANIRTNGVQGIRFKASVGNTAKALSADNSNYEISEYGFIVTAETEKTGLKNEFYTLDMALVNDGKAVKGVAYNKSDSTDIVYALDDDRTVFTVVLKNIPLVSRALTTTVVTRPYYILSDGENETVIYGEITKRSVYDVARAIKNAGGTDYTDNKDYIDNIMEIVASKIESDDEITFDASELFKN